MAIGVTAVAVTASGCGGSGNAVQKAAQRTLSAAGYQVSFTSTIQLPDPGAKPLRLAGKGSVDNRSRRARIVVSGAVGGEEIVDAAGSTRLYLRFPEVSAQLKSQKRWLRLDVTKQLWRSHFNAGALVMTQGNPAQYVDALGRPKLETRKLGNGLYSATIAVAGRSLPVRIWIDDGYLRQLQLVYSVAVPGSKDRIGYRTTIGYGEFGPQPPIALPAAGEVARIGADGKLEQ